MRSVNSTTEAVSYLTEITRSIKDYPRKGIVFRDLTTIFQDRRAMAYAIDLLAGSISDSNLGDLKYDKFVGIEARGFVLAGALSSKLGGGVILARKPDKLPYLRKRVEYKLEYGEDALEMHEDAIKPGEKVIVIDDLLATGGTAEAACKLVEELGGEVIKVVFLVELPTLNGRIKLSRYQVDSIISFSGE